MKLSEAAQKIGGVLEGADMDVRGVAALDVAGANEISFLSNPRYASQVASTKAAAVLVPEDWGGECRTAVIRVKNPDAAFAKATALFYTPPPKPAIGIHPTAVVDETVELGEGVSVGPHCVIEAGAKIGARTVLMAGCYVGYRSLIGEDGLLYPHVSLREFVTIGDRVILHNGTVIGSDGFGYSVDSHGVRTKIPQIGSVEIGNDVEMGANVAIDRARFGKTKIGNGVKIDNLVQIAHNVEIGDHAVIVAQVGVAGSTSIGAKTILAGQAGISGHIKIGSGVIVGPQSGVSKDIPDGLHVLGAPAAPVAQMKRMHAGIMLLPRLKERLLALEAKVKLIQGG